VIADPKTSKPTQRDAVLGRLRPTVEVARLPFVEDDYTKRLDPEEVLAELRGLPDGQSNSGAALPLRSKLCRGEIQMLTQSQLACISRAIASPFRLRILANLGNATEPVSYQALRREHTMRAPTFSHHVRELRLAGLVEIVRHGKSASLSFCHETWHQYIEQLSRI
jgi:ArsR family transcriptional regulator